MIAGTLVGLWLYMGWLFFSVDDDTRSSWMRVPFLMVGPPASSQTFSGHSSSSSERPRVPYLERTAMEGTTDVSHLLHQKILGDQGADGFDGVDATLRSRENMLETEDHSSVLETSDRHVDATKNERKSHQTRSKERMKHRTHNPRQLVLEWQRRAELNDQSFGWVALPVCIFGLIMAIHQVWKEYYGFRGSSNQFYIGGPQRWRDNNNLLGNTGDHQERMSSVLHTLDLINQDRQERGEPTVSLESYLAFQQVLSDRTIWIGLAEQFQQNGWMVRRGTSSNTDPSAANRRISLHHLEDLCPNWKVTKQNISNEECSICLASYESSDILRTLPCCHKFHRDCIDQWMSQSTYCPMCKCLILQEVG
jgi:Ring finger domain